MYVYYKLCYSLQVYITSVATIAQWPNQLQTFCSVDIIQMAITV